MVKTHGLDRAAYYLVLIGGILLVLLNILALIGHAISMPFSVPLVGMTFGFAFLPLILGIVAIILAKRVTELEWAIVLIIVGFLGGGIGGILVLLGGLLGLISKYV
ncbi:MAG: hypothetical protein ABSF00_13390 [Candidatus Bathyarchaeia archaeon]